MSHIPSTAMPHARAHDDDDDAQAQPEGALPEPADQSTQSMDEDAAQPPVASSATDRAQDMAAAGPSSDDEPPLASAAPSTATGNRQGSNAEATAETAGGAATGGQSGVDGMVSAVHRDTAPEARDADHRSTALVVAAVLGGLAALGGVVAAVLPLLRDRRDGGRKKGKKRKG